MTQSTSGCGGSDGLLSVRARSGVVHAPASAAASRMPNNEVDCEKDLFLSQTRCCSEMLSSDSGLGRASCQAGPLCRQCAGQTVVLWSFCLPSARSQCSIYVPCDQQSVHVRPARACGASRRTHRSTSSCESTAATGCYVRTNRTSLPTNGSCGVHDGLSESDSCDANRAPAGVVGHSHRKKRRHGDVVGITTISS